MSTSRGGLTSDCLVSFQTEFWQVLSAGEHRRQRLPTSRFRYSRVSAKTMVGLIVNVKTTVADHLYRGNLF